jgi:electron-transferring-flavoprotein dehydrogenase
MLAAEAAFDAVSAGRSADELSAYPEAFKNSWLHTELKKSRNFKPWMSKGLYVGTLMVGIEQKLLGGNVPWTIHNTHADHEYLKPAAECEPIAYPKPDGVISFDKLSSVFISNTNHEENQPAHLTLKNNLVPTATNLAIFDGPEQRYCPAGVYEYIESDAGKQLQINAQNCVHCKTCDIKDPTQNIVWLNPEGGGGPNYSGM